MTDVRTPRDRETLDALLRADQRRSRGAPTVSLLIGPFAAAGEAWRRFAAETGRDAVLWRVPAGESVAHAASKRLCESGALRAAALAFVARLDDRPVADVEPRWRSASELDVRLLRERLSDESPLLAGLLVAIFRAHSETDAEADDGLAWRRFAESLDREPAFPSTSPERDEATLQAIAELATRVEPTVWPALLLASSSEHAGDAPLVDTADGLVALAVAWPRLPLALALRDDEFAAFERDLPESFAKAALRENSLRVRADESNGFARGDRDEETSLGDDTDEERLPAAARAVVERFREAGVSPRVVERAREAAVARANVAKESGEPDARRRRTDEARSAAERLLHELLEEDAELAGLFSLNGDPGLVFGGRAMEVDLLSTTLRVALEVDGYWHFVNLEESYRRDRRKDVALQQHDHLVARFLADDVLDDPTTVREAVRSIVRRRREHLSLQERS